MICLACRGFTFDVLCRDCAAGFSRAFEAELGSDLRAIAPFQHRGTARKLVHVLKYQGVVAAAEPLVAAMADLAPRNIPALVPVPRSAARAIRYGIDPAVVLAHGVGFLTGIPVIDALRAPLWWKRHAVRGRADRRWVPFRRRRDVPPGAALVDDVLTTGPRSWPPGPRSRDFLPLRSPPLPRVGCDQETATRPWRRSDGIAVRHQATYESTGLAFASNDLPASHLDGSIARW
jgi:predicted amidophosphoribosyltransferase